MATLQASTFSQVLSGARPVSDSARIKIIAEPRNRASGLRSTAFETHCIQLGMMVSSPMPSPATQTIAAPTRSTSPRLLLTSTKGSTDMAISAAEARPTSRA